MRVQEGLIPVSGEYRVWYRITGGGADHERIPLLALHGGPGIPHDYIENLADIASDSRRVILYDQLGCGRSDQPDDTSLWRVDRFVEELATVRRELGLERIHLLGQSWGGMLAIEYMLTQPEGIVSLILASTLSSMPLWVAEANRLRNALPPEIQATLLRHEHACTTDSAEYQQAMMAFYERHVIRVVPMPDQVKRALEQAGQVYYTMNGPSEFHVTGVIKDWDRTSRLAEIRVPTLITSGRYDESTPRINEILHHGITGSEWVVFENSAHMAHIEEPELFLPLVQSFMERTEAQHK
ncbi:MAG: proline iminopeptidase-family hydrolase [Chloroflexota bacterium]|nr:proline iminopeptidase-family hydrolase [Chloroflexota bacterium]